MNMPISLFFHLVGSLCDAFFIDSWCELQKQKSSKRPTMNLCPSSIGKVTHIHTTHMFNDRLLIQFSYHAFLAVKIQTVAAKGESETRSRVYDFHYRNFGNGSIMWIKRYRSTRIEVQLDR